MNVGTESGNLYADPSKIVTTDCPAGGKAIQSNGFLFYNSDFIPVKSGEILYGEVWQKYIGGDGGVLYFGLERFDKNKKPIANNSGCNYFVAAAANQSENTWKKYSGYISVASVHSPYQGSDGGAVSYVRIRVLFNYNAGGALRELGPIVLKISAKLQANTKIVAMASNCQMVILQAT